MIPKTAIWEVKYALDIIKIKTDTTGMGISDVRHIFEKLSRIQGERIKIGR